MAGNRCGYRSSSTGPRMSRASALSVTKLTAAIFATPRNPMPPTVPRDSVIYHDSIRSKLGRSFLPIVQSRVHCSVVTKTTTELFPSRSTQPSAPLSDTAVVTGQLPMLEQVNLREELEAVGIDEILRQLDHELIGLKPVKTRIR